MFSLKNFSLIMIIVGFYQYNTYASADESSYELGLAILGDGEAFSSEQVQEVANLIISGVNVNHPTNSGGMCPLHLVFMHFFIPGNVDDVENGKTIIELLINAGANIHALMGDPASIRRREIRGKAPLNIAIENNSPMELILTLIGDHSCSDYEDCLQKFIKNINRHEQAKLKEMFNQWLTAKRKQDYLKRIEAGPITFNDGSTALHKAMTQLSTKQSILNILKTGVDINAVDSNGNTALHLAIQKNLNSIVQLLLEQKGINITLLNNDGKLALQLADSSEMEQIVKNSLPENIETNFEMTENLKNQITIMRHQAFEEYKQDLAIAFEKIEEEEKKEQQKIATKKLKRGKKKPIEEQQDIDTTNLEQINRQPIDTRQLTDLDVALRNPDNMESLKQRLQFKRNHY